MSNSTDEIAPPTAANKKCTTDAPTKTQHVNDCKLVSITLPNAGPLGLGLLEQDGGKSVVIDEVIPQSQAEKYGVLPGDIPVYNNSISSIVGGVGYISYETFLQRANNVRPFVFSVLRHTTDKSSSTDKSSIDEAAAPSRKLKLLDGSPEPIKNEMVQEENINADTDAVGQNNTTNINNSAAVGDMSAKLAEQKTKTTIKELEVYMKTWLLSPEGNLMPSKSQKDKIILETGIERSQLEGWLYR